MLPVLWNRITTSACEYSARHEPVRIRLANSAIRGSREKVNDQNQVVIVDLADANNVLRRPSEFQAAGISGQKLG